MEHVVAVLFLNGEQWAKGPGCLGANGRLHWPLTLHMDAQKL
jgi:hypothetical protein